MANCMSCFFLIPKLATISSLIIALQEPLKVPLQLRWRRGPDMPFRMAGYVQSVVVQGRAYVGGGYDVLGSDDNNTVMEYDINSGKWAKLVPYTVRDFAMTAINNQLVLVGGWPRGNGHSSVLGVWSDEKWTYPYQDMPTARSWCSAVVYNEWLIVAGGWGDDKGCVSHVEVMNTGSKQWSRSVAPPTPWSSTRIAIVGDTCYCLGGTTGQSIATTEVYSASLPDLTSQLCSFNSKEKGNKHQIWKEIPGLQTTRSAPLSIRGSLLAVGGRDENEKAVTAIHLYQPDTGEWVKVGDLPTPRYDCTCAMITDREMIVVGGIDDDGSSLCRSDILQID